MTLLKDLYNEGGQSPWIDNLSRQSVLGGGLKSLVDRGVRGVTSNPTIFQKAMTSSDVYDEDFAALVQQMSVEDAFWKMATTDITNACGLLRPVHDDADGTDGFVSLEVSPALASDTQATTEAARQLHQQIALPNLMVKIPATAEGVPAIRQMISEGRNINVTLIFSLDRYAEVMDAYIEGLEALDAAGGDLSDVHSVASFFVSRVDTEVDRRLAATGADSSLAGKAAVAQAKLAYALYQEKFSGSRWDQLAAKGARAQRPLWASTSTKNPAYPDLLYVDSLIGPNTVNTMPDATLEAFADHGKVASTITDGVEEARGHLDHLASVGIDMADVSDTLEEEGVASFVKSYDELLQALSDKANALRGSR